MKIQLSTDAALIASFISELQEHHHQLAPEMFRTMSSTKAQNVAVDLLSQPNHYFYLAFEEEQPIGFLWLEEIPVRDNGLIHLESSLHIAGILTSKKWRNQGVSQGLLAYSEKIAKEKGFSKITLDFWALNHLEQFYQKHGYEPYKYQMSKILD